MLRSVRTRRRLVPALAASVLLTLIGPAGPVAPAGAAVASTSLVTTIAGNGAGSDTPSTGQVATGKAFGDVWAVGDMDGTILTTDRTSCRAPLPCRHASISRAANALSPVSSSSPRHSVRLST